jgi:hypothetical protein
MTSKAVNCAKGLERQAGGEVNWRVKSKEK